MPTRFTASQGVEIAIPEQPIPIQHYLRQPQRLVNALVEPNRIEQISEEHFRLKMRPITFMTLSVQPTVDLRVWAESNGTIRLQSLGCEIRGVEYINQRFALNLKGYLSPRQLNTGTRLQGRADLEVQVELPPPFSFTPRPFLEATGNGLLKSVLLTIKQRLQHQLIADYRHWVSIQTEADISSQAPILPYHASLLNGGGMGSPLGMGGDPTPVAYGGKPAFSAGSRTQLAPPHPIPYTRA